jgi:hypothetical protein
VVSERYLKSTTTSRPLRNNTERQRRLQRTEQPIEMSNPAMQVNAAIGVGQPQQQQQQPDMATILAQMVQMQRQTAEAQNQLALVMQQQNLILTQQALQQKESSAHGLARTTAGQAPLFYGRSNTIEASEWHDAMERWFETAKVVNEEERITIAASAMREAAMHWWTMEIRDPARKANYDTWSKMIAAAEKQFMPADTIDWALEQLDVLSSNEHADVREYIAEFKRLAKRAGEPAPHDATGVKTRLCELVPL